MAKAKQSAGDNSQQLIVRGDLNQYGMSVNDVNAIVDLHVEKVVANYRLDSIKAIEEKVGKFERHLFQNLGDKGLLEVVKKPSYQKDLFDAAVAIAGSDDDSGEAMLTELLIERAKVPDEQGLKIAIHKALQVISNLDNKSLNGLAGRFLISHLSSDNWFLDMHFQLFRNIKTSFDEHDGLPAGKVWQSNLDELDLLKFESSIISHPTFVDLFAGGSAKRFLVDGFPNEQLESSKKYINKINPKLLTYIIDHPLLDQHKLLAFKTKDEYDNILVELGFDPDDSAVFTLGQMNNFGSTNILAKEKLESLIRSDPDLSPLSAWWNSLQTANFSMTGKLIAYLHGKTIMSLPPFSLDQFFKDEI